MTTSKASDSLGCVYLVDLTDSYVRMALWSIVSLRQWNPTLPVLVLVVSHGGELETPDRDLLGRLVAVADEVRIVEPLHLDSGYFFDNRAHLGTTGFKRLVYLDADTLIFGSFRELIARYRKCDVVARPSDWAWRVGYRASLAPDIICPMNGGVVLMSAEFADAWSTETRRRSAALLERTERIDLAEWLYSVSPTAWSREEWAFSELAWEGSWSVGMLADSDCHLLAQHPDREDPSQWRRSTILHTFNNNWTRCMERLLWQ